ncbi:MAG: 16S rRNA (cytosine(967)-C(5))-methyltransferase RsmB [Dethiobacter sp.]|jgi:16S rRNA (cytosine967-C5)-methyltransferase|nr:16S rRNA (cytosine(967)-C(5))-methyltransferase RsmB [Dethiobacter sp.]
MKKKLDAREASLLALKRVEEDGAFVNLALTEVLFGKDIDPRDRRLAAEISYGVITYKLTLDWMISHAAGRPVDKIDKPLLNILRIGFYQLFYLDRIPAAAACHSAVELTKKSKKGALAPFVNGVLRGALRKKDSLPWPKREDDEAAYLTLVYSHPGWLVKRWLARLGAKETEALLAANNRYAPLTLRTNTLKTTRSELLLLLGEQGLKVRPGELVPESIILEAGGRLDDIVQHRQGYFMVQGESAMLTSRVLEPQPGERVLDCCSAPGGKTAHIAQLMDNQGEIEALDIYPHRLELVEANCRRLGVNIVNSICADARDISCLERGSFDRVLLDAPCSGLGVIRLKPDIRWRRQERDIHELASVQAVMLKEAAQATRPGGVLVYSTCTNEPEETDLVIESFLKGHPRFRADSAKPYLPESVKGAMGRTGVHLYPHLHNADGFFICRLVHSQY